jgi:hypothetical protein
MANNLIFRDKHLEEFTVTTDVPEHFRFNGVIPFDMTIEDSVIYAKVFAVDFNEAVERLNNFLESCK